MDSIKNKIKGCNIMKPVEGWVVEYPQFNDLSDQQFQVLWPFDEPLVENDVQDVRVKLTEAEKDGVIQVLKLFTTYEIHVGDDYWSGRIMRRFKRPEIQRMASLFSAVEFNSHAGFYNRVNELLYLDTEEFYSEWKTVEELKQRMDFISEAASDDNDLLSIAAFSFIEGAVLYSSFAFLKHFQAQECGKDLMRNICRGINLSVVDESLHAVGGATLFNTLKQECNLNNEENLWLEDQIHSIAKSVYDHECKIVDIVFGNNKIKGITKEQLISFVAHRCNTCLENLGYEAIFEEEDNAIEKWFYKNIRSVNFTDFFAGNGSEYQINWREDEFGKVWK